MKTCCLFLLNGRLILILLTLGACHKAVDPTTYPDERGELLANLNVASSNRKLAYAIGGTVYLVSI